MGHLTYETFEEMRANQPGIPFVLAEPCSVGIPDSGIDAMEATLQRLLDRVVRPMTVEAVTARAPEAPLLAALDPLIQRGKVIQGRRFQGGLTRQRRPVDFFAEADDEKGVALDVLNFEKKSEESMGERADAEAFKILDLKQNRFLNEFYVFCLFPQQSAKVRATESARKADSVCRRQGCNQSA